MKLWCSHSYNLLWVLEGNEIAFAYYISIFIFILGHDNYVSSAIFCNHGKTIISCSWDKSIKMWNIHPFENDSIESG